MWIKSAKDSMTDVIEYTCKHSGEFELGLKCTDKEMECYCKGKQPDSAKLLTTFNVLINSALISCLNLYDAKDDKTLKFMCHTLLEEYYSEIEKILKLMKTDMED